VSYILNPSFDVIWLAREQIHRAMIYVPFEPYWALEWPGWHV